MYVCMSCLQESLHSPVVSCNEGSLKVRQMSLPATGITSSIRDLRFRSTIVRISMFELWHAEDHGWREGLKEH